MGEAYRTTDTQLKRQVAIKLLPRLLPMPFTKSFQTLEQMQAGFTLPRKKKQKGLSN